MPRKKNTVRAERKLKVSDLTILELISLMGCRANADGSRSVRWRGEDELKATWLAVRDDVMARRPTNLPVERWPIFERYG